MKRLCLLRHAKAKRKAETDFVRPLSKRGRKAARRMGAWMESNGLIPQLTLCSPSARTLETWACVRDACALSAEPRLLQSLYGAPPSTLMARVRAASAEMETLLVIGHNPGLAHFAAQLAGPGSDAAALQALGEKYPTAALAVLEAPIDAWRALGWSQARLVQFIKPADLS